MTPTQAREKAEQLVASVAGGNGYYGCLYDAIARALLLAQVEAVEGCRLATLQTIELAFPWTDKPPEPTQRVAAN